MTIASIQRSAFCIILLWSLLGDLPFNHRPKTPRLMKTEKGHGYTLEHLELDLNGVEPVPALLLIPDKRQQRAPGLLYIHWHGGTYPTGKMELLTGQKVLPAYAPVVAEKGIVTLAIDSWCFGERQRNSNGRTGEEDAFKFLKALHHKGAVRQDGHVDGLIGWRLG